MIICNLQKILDKKEITQKELAASTGIRLPTISDYCNNKFKSISRDNLNKICKHLNCKVNKIIEYKKE